MNDVNDFLKEGDPIEVNRKKVVDVIRTWFGFSLVESARVYDLILSRGIGTPTRPKTALEYYAAHAPLVRTTDEDGDPTDGPPYWFRSDDPNKPKNLAPQVGKELREYYKAIRLWEADRFFAWRWYDAEQMFKTRPKPKGEMPK